MEHRPAAVKHKLFRSRAYSFQPGTGLWCSLSSPLTVKVDSWLCSTDFLIGNYENLGHFYGFMVDKTNIDSNVGFHELEEQRGAGKERIGLPTSDSVSPAITETRSKENRTCLPELHVSAR